MSDINFKTLLTATLNESENANDGIVTPAMVNKHLKDHFKYGFVKHEVYHSGLGTIAKKASDKGIKEIVFDRGGYLYHGRVKALAEAARENGLEF